MRFSRSTSDIWELTLVTLDKPFLFSNISGVLSYFGMDIHRGQAMTTPDGLVLDVFEFSDEEAFLKKNPAGDERHLPDAGGRPLPEPSTSPRYSPARCAACSIGTGRGRHEPPVIHFDNEHSRKFTVLEIVADDAPGLLYRISRVISGQGCDVELVLIATEGQQGGRRAARHEARSQVVGFGSGRADAGTRTGAGGRE